MTGEVVPIGKYKGQPVEADAGSASTMPKLRYAKPCVMCGIAVVPERSTRRFCDVACRMRSYRRRRDGPLRRRLKPLAVAHQARLCPGSDLDIATATVRPITYAQARDVIERNEWLGSMPALVTYSFGIFFGAKIAGAVCFGPEPGENLNIWQRYGYQGRIIALLRGASEPWAHPHSASKLISGAIRLLPSQHAIVTACVDRTAGEFGCVYQAANFTFVGCMGRAGDTRALIVHEGRVISERQAKRRFGTAGRRQLAALGIRAFLVERRRRYFLFRGTATERAALRAAIAHLERPYPKRRHGHDAC
jgi:hypothetical protein